MTGISHQSQRLSLRIRIHDTAFSRHDQDASPRGPAAALHAEGEQELWTHPKAHVPVRLVTEEGLGALLDDFRPNKWLHHFSLLCRRWQVERRRGR